MTFTVRSYVINKRILSYAKNHGVSLTCAVCHEPVREGQEVKAGSGRYTRYRHKECYEAGLIG